MLLIPIPEMMLPEFNTAGSFCEGGRNEIEFWLADTSDPPFRVCGRGLDERGGLGSSEQTE
jgi:hypothetical protein